MNVNKMILPGSLILALLLGLACSEEGSFRPNQPPETSIFLGDGDLQPVHYMQVLHWHGEDADGEVARFEYKWTLPIGSTDFDTTWVGMVEPFVTSMTDTFFIPVPTSGTDTTLAHFQIRAVDEEGLADLTPAEINIKVFNSAPELFFMNTEGGLSPQMAVADTILPAITLQFKVDDPDIDAPEGEMSTDFIREIRFWFEDPEEFISVAGSDTSLTLFPDDFGDQLGIERVFHMQAYDLGGAQSNVLSDTTFVRNLSGVKALMLDSADSGSSTVTTVDPFWHDEVAGLFNPGEVVIHDVELMGDIDHPQNLYAIFSLFEAVIWYNGGAGAAPGQYQSYPTPEIERAEEGLRSYIENGGKALLAGYNLVGASVGDIAGACFSEEFEEDVLMVDSLYVHSTGLPEGYEVSPNWRIYPNREILGFTASAGTDTLRNATALVGADRMALNDDAIAAGLIEELYRVEGSSVSPSSMFDGAAGVRRMFDTGGELVLLTFPISLAGGYDNELEEVENFLQRFGVLP